MNNIEIFNDSQSIISNNMILKESTEHSSINSVIYNENFHSDKMPYFRNSRIKVEENLTLSAAHQSIKRGKKTAVLNFANPLEPGGGVLRGAGAQEEYICRATNLYNCLVSPWCADYYDYHKKLLGEKGLVEVFLASDKIIYTPDIIVFKQDCDYIPKTNLPFKQIYTDNWFKIDVLTCAAPYFSDEYFLIDEHDLLSLFEKRIRNILEVAIEHEEKSIILGAFGCGAFCNPPEIVAKAFKNVFNEQRYKYTFEEVVFAIKRKYSVCRNLMAFEEVLDNVKER